MHGSGRGLSRRGVTKPSRIVSHFIGDLILYPPTLQPPPPVSGKAMDGA
jgi:hypothetical protein